MPEGAGSVATTAVPATGVPADAKKGVPTSAAAAIKTAENRGELDRVLIIKE